jgi:hypothetical protein
MSVVPEQRTSDDVDRELHMLHGIVTTREQRLSELRHNGVRRTLRFLDMGHRRAALEFMLISFEQQARAIGLRDVRLPRHELDES